MKAQLKKLKSFKFITYHISVIPEPLIVIVSKAKCMVNGEDMYLTQLP